MPYKFELILGRMDNVLRYFNSGQMRQDNSFTFLQPQNKSSQLQSDPCEVKSLKKTLPKCLNGCEKIIDKNKEKNLVELAQSEKERYFEI